MGCWLSLYLTARPKYPEKKLPRQLGDALKGMLVARGIPLGQIEITNRELTGAVPRAGNDPVEVADALGYVLYCDANLKVKLTPKLPKGQMVGQFTKDELATYQPGDAGPLSANRVVVKGELVDIKLTKDSDGTVVKDRVSTGWRTTTTSSKVRGKKHITSEVVLEPPSEISRFSASYEKTTDPNALIFRFSTPLEEPAIKSQETTVTTTRDSKGYIVKRERLVKGCAAKGLSSFYSAWAGASMPKPDASTLEPEATTTPLEGGGGNREYAEVGVGGGSTSVANNGSTTFAGGGSSRAIPITLLKPSGMFGEVTLLDEVEEWEYKANKVTYTREQKVPLGAIIPEIGNPLFGYQEPSEESSPRYHDPLPLNLAEREVIKWAKDELGRWESFRTLSQAIGIRNAQEPRDAMGSVQFPDERASKIERSVVAIEVATQLKVATSSQQFSEPPGPSPIEEMQEVEIYTPFEETIDVSGSDLLDRTLEITPSPFCASLEGVRKVAQYAALELRGQANTLKVGLPLSVLPYDLPPNSVIELGGIKYLVVAVSATVGSAEAILNLDLWEL